MKYQAVLLAIVLGAIPAFSAVITFDDLPARTAGSIPQGYANLFWSTGFTFFDPLNYFGSVPNGYSAGIVSGPNIAYNSNADFSNGGAISFFSSSAFTFTSVYLTAAWYDNLQVTVAGSLGGVAVAGDLLTVTLNATRPTFFTFNWAGIDRVTFTPSGGTPHGYSGSGHYFLMDNLEVTTTPEPGAAGLLGAGLAGLFCFRFLRLRPERSRLSGL